MTDKDGRTPLHDAAQAGSEHTVFRLINKGADVKATDKDGHTPLYDAAQAGSKHTIRQLMARMQMPLRMSTTTVLQRWHLNWGGLKTYEACNGAIGDILTISTRSPGTNSYMAKSV